MSSVFGEKFQTYLHNNALDVPVGSPRFPVKMQTVKCWDMRLSDVLLMEKQKAGDKWEYNFYRTECAHAPSQRVPFVNVSRFIFLALRKYMNS